MNLVNKSVVHGTFGQGNVVSCDNDYIEINFDTGMKKFVFPDVFGEFMTFTDEEANNLVDKKIEKIEEERKIALKIEQERRMEEERRQAIEQNQSSRNSKVNPKLQSVFWCDEQEEEEVFENWKVFVGEIKSGVRKGQPRKLARINPKSACLITKREHNIQEEDRTILGMFMATEDFDGRSCEDGYIVAHPEHRLRLSKEESEKMLFWNYYIDEKFPERITWNSGKQRYFDNVWMAQMLRDIALHRKETEQGEKAQLFFEYFCTINRINREELPAASGALVQMD